MRNLGEGCGERDDVCGDGSTRASDQNHVEP